MQKTEEIYNWAKQNDYPNARGNPCRDGWSLMYETFPDDPVRLPYVEQCRSLE